jgi:flagellar L-ring protein precursor FlgH
MMRATLAGWIGAVMLAVAGAAPSQAADLYQPGNWSSLAADRTALQVGDVLTVAIDENSTASNSARTGSSKSSNFLAQLAAAFTPNSSVSGSGSLDLGSSFSGSGQTQRVHKMVAQISVTVDRVFPNGDLEVSGAQALKINGERTNIRLKGRVRVADIASDNSVLSTRLADAVIDYDGAGFIANSNRPGIVSRLFEFLGLP